MTKMKQTRTCNYYPPPACGRFIYFPYESNFTHRSKSVIMQIDIVNQTVNINLCSPVVPAVPFDFSQKPGTISVYWNIKILMSFLRSCLIK